MAAPDETPQPVNRRRLMKGVTWATPIAVVATAAPAIAASTETLEGITVTGRCGGLGLIGQGFQIVAPDDTPIPAGSVLTITRSSPVSVGLLNLELDGFDNIASVNLLNSTTSQVVFNSEWSGAGRVGSVVTVSVGVSTSALLTVPSGFELGATSKPEGKIQQVLALVCRDE